MGFGLLGPRSGVRPARRDTDRTEHNHPGVQRDRCRTRA